MADYKNKEFAESFFKGIKPSYIQADGTIKSDAFYFRYNKELSRKETSINWNDSKKSLKILLNIKDDDGNKLFSYGYVEYSMYYMKTEFYDLINSNELQFSRDPITKKILFFDINVNKYHGNLVVGENCNSNDRTFIMSKLALFANENCVKIIK